MNILKKTFILASGILLVLFTLLLMIQNPTKARYDRVVCELLTRSNFSTIEEVLGALPELQVIKDKMESANYLSTAVRIKMQSPVPATSERESRHIQVQLRKIRQLRKEIIEHLEELKIDSNTIAFERDFK